MNLTQPSAALRSAGSLLTELAGTSAIWRRLLLVVAHPDDETIAMGGQLRRFRDALLVHITDGAPRDGEDARRHGFADCVGYAAARRRELAAALIAGEAATMRTVAIGIPDKQSFLDLAGLSRQLADLLRREQPVAVLTHAYEGGHPDHDAAAFAVQAACLIMPPEDRPAIIEMPFYHARDGKMITGRFLPRATEEIVVVLGETDLRRKHLMAECFDTQRELLPLFDLSRECFRLAPFYDFGEPPHSGTLLYETFGWGIAGADWRRHAVEALDSLGALLCR